MNPNTPTLEPPKKLEYQTPNLELHNAWKALVGAPQSVPIQLLRFDEDAI
jgi:hypothetical protein